MASTIEQAVYKLGVDADEAVKSLRDTEKAAQGVAQSLGNVVSVQTQATRGTRDHAAGFERLLASLDPVLKAEQERDRVLARLASYEKKGIGTDIQHIEAAWRAHEKYLATIKKIEEQNNKNKPGNEEVEASFEDVAKKLGEMASKFGDTGKKISTFTEQLANVSKHAKAFGLEASDSMKNVLPIVSNVGSALFGLMAVYELAKLGVQAFYNLHDGRQDRVKKDLEEHERLVGKIKEMYSKTDEAAKELAETERATVQFLASRVEKRSREELAKRAGEFLTAVQPPAFFFHDESTFQVKAEFKAAQGALEDFYKSARQLEDIIRLQNAISTMGNMNEDAREKLVAMTKAMRDQADQLRKDAAATGGAKGESKALDILGVDRTPVAATRFELKIQEIKDRNKELQLLAASEGRVTEEATRMRIEHDLVRAAMRSADDEAKELSEENKQLAATYARLFVELQRAKVNAQITFERRSSFLTEEDRQIAERLKVLYGNDIPKALASTEAAAMRMNQTMRQVGDVVLGNMSSALTSLALNELPLFVQGAENASVAFKKFADVVIRELTRILIQMTIMRAVGQGLQMLVPGGIGGGTTGIGPTLVNPFGGILSHTGGIVGEPGGGSRYVHPAYFENAPRFHRGGMVGSDEVPTILQKGERVIPKGQSEGRTEVNIFPIAGTTFEKRERREGGRNIQDLVQKQVNEQVVNGRADNAMGARFGARPRGVER